MMAMRCSLVLVLAGVGALPSIVFAQDDQSCAPGMGITPIFFPAGKTASPFTATERTTFDLRLADGNIIHGTMETHEARDSAGRTMYEAPGGCERGKDGRMHARFTVTVRDPKAKTLISWQVDSAVVPKVAHLSRQQPPPEAPKPPTAEERAEQLKRQAAITSTAMRQENRTEQLGTRNFHGITAEGVRFTNTVPPGEEGNSLPLLTIHETWTSRQLGITLMGVTDDPLRGKTTFELDDISLDEPAAALFSPPPGYTIEELHQSPVETIPDASEPR